MAAAAMARYRGGTAAMLPPTCASGVRSRKSPLRHSCVVAASARTSLLLLFRVTGAGFGLRFRCEKFGVRVWVSGFAAVP
jgi:hypothetical protein